MKFKCRFTLAELLVIVALFAVLAALLMPVLCNAREQGTGVSCTDNLKKIGTAMSAYQENNQGYFIHFDRVKTSRRPNSQWTGGLIDPGYCQASDFICSGLQAAPRFPQTYVDTYGVRFPGYGLSCDTAGSGRFSRGVNRRYTVRNNTWLHRSDVRYFSRMYVAMDCAKGTAEEPFQYGFYRFYTDNVAGDGNPDARHSGSINILYADGHAANSRIADRRNPFADLGTSWKNVQWNGWDEVQ